MIQKTLGIIKPDAVKRNLIGAILKDIEDNGFKIVNLRKTRMTQKIASEFYQEHIGKPFFQDLVDYMTSDDIVVYSIEGENAIVRYRELMGTTDPETAKEGTLRSKYAESKSRNSVHGSDSIDAAKRELSIFNI